MDTPVSSYPAITAFADPLVNAIDRVIRCLDGLSADELHWQPPAPGTNSLYVLAVHTMGSAEESVLGVLGGQGIRRDRDAEFVASGDAIAPLLARWEDLRRRLREMLAVLTPSVMEHEYQHRRFGAMSGYRYLVLAAQHPAEHAGHAELTRELLLAAREAKPDAEA